MRGHIFRRFRGSYQIVLYLGKDPVTGKYKQKWIAVKGKRRNAEHTMSELIHQYNLTGYIDTTRLTTKEFLERWLSVIKSNLSAQSYERSASIVHQHLIPDFGNIAISKLMPEDLQRHYARQLAAGLKPGTVKKHHATIHAALAAAVKWGLIYRNIADIVDSPRYKRVEMETWDADEMNVFLDRNVDSEYYPLFYTALFTGMRRSELLGLKWMDIDFLMCQVAVRRTLEHLTDGSYLFQDVKTEKSRRNISLSPNVIGVLRNLFNSQPVKLTAPDSLVFSGPAGQPLRPNTVSRAWQLACRKAGVKVIRLHDARHTHATLMLKQGVHPKIVQERLGHSSIQMTLDTYSHVVPGLQEAAALKFDELVKQKTNN